MHEPDRPIGRANQRPNALLISFLAKHSPAIGQRDLRHLIQGFWRQGSAPDHPLGATLQRKLTNKYASRTLLEHRTKKRRVSRSSVHTKRSRVQISASRPSVAPGRHAGVMMVGAPAPMRRGGRSHPLRSWDKCGRGGLPPRPIAAPKWEYTRLKLVPSKRRCLVPPRRVPGREPTHRFTRDIDEAQPGIPFP